MLPSFVTDVHGVDLPFNAVPCPLSCHMPLRRDNDAPYSHAFALLPLHNLKPDPEELPTFPRTTTDPPAQAYILRL